jgi:hypothetical protein
MDERWIVFVALCVALSFAFVFGITWRIGSRPNEKGPRR